MWEGLRQCTRERCDGCAQKIAKSKTITRKWDLWNTGVTTDAFTCKQSQIMVGTVFTYGIIQVCLLPFLPLPCLVAKLRYQGWPSG